MVRKGKSVGHSRHLSLSIVEGAVQPSTEEPSYLEVHHETEGIKSPDVLGVWLAAEAET